MSEVVNKTNLEPTNVNPERDAVNAIRTNASLTFQQRWEAICKLQSPYGELARFLQEFQDTMSANNPKVVDYTEKEGDNITYRLYSKLYQACNTHNYPDFKTKFDIINLAFYVFKNDSYSEFKLFRYGYGTIFGPGKRKTFQNLCTVVANLCDPFTRQETLKKITLQFVLTKEGTVFTDDIINNIFRYYRSYAG